MRVDTYSPPHRYIAAGAIGDTTVFFIAAVVSIAAAVVRIVARFAAAIPGAALFPACYLPRPRPRPLAASLTIPTLAASLAAVAPVDPLPSSSGLPSRPPSLPRRHHRRPLELAPRPPQSPSPALARYCIE